MFTQTFTYTNYPQHKKCTTANCISRDFFLLQSSLLLFSPIYVHFYLVHVRRTNKIKKVQVFFGKRPYRPRVEREITQLTILSDGDTTTKETTKLFHSFSFSVHVSLHFLYVQVSSRKRNMLRKRVRKGNWICIFHDQPFKDFQREPSLELS